MDSTDEFQALRQAAETLRASEARYRDLFEDSPISMWEEDFSVVKAYLDELRSQGVTDLEAHLTANPEVVHQAMRRIRILDINEATLKLYGARDKQDLLKHVDRVLGPGTFPLIVAELKAIESGASEFDGLGVNYKLSGEPMDVALRWFVPGSQKQSLSRIILTIQDVTEARRAEAALRASQARYRNLFEDSPISMWEEDFSAVKAYLDELRSQGVTDLEAHLTANPEVVHQARRRIRILDINQATLKLYGARDKQDLLKHVDRVLGPGSLPLVVAELKAIESGASEFDGLSVNYKLSGEPMDVALRWFVPGSQKQSLSRIILTIQDVTEARRAEAALRASQARYRDLFELAPIAMGEQDFSAVQAYLDDLRRQGVTDLDAYLTGHPTAAFEAMSRIKVLDVNQAALKLYGAETKEALLGQLDKVLGPATFPMLKDELLALDQGATEFGGLGVNYKLSGEPMEVALHWFIPGAREEGLARLLVTIQDVTAERRAQAALRESEARFRAYIERSPEGIFVVDARGRYLEANPAACALVGYTREELLSLTVRDLATPEEAEQGTRFLQLLATGTFSGELLLRRKDGTSVSASLNAVKLPDDTYLGFCTDITERKEMEQALHEERASLARRVAERTAEMNAANAELVRAMRAKDDFLATMSHELRTPLTGILGLSESLQMGTYGDLNESQLRALRMIQTSGEHLLALITDVLDLAKIGAEKLELQTGWVPAADVCQASLRLVQPQANKKNIRVSFRMDNAVQYIRIDARRFKQMLLNLLGNAVKFTPEGGTIGLQVTGDAQMKSALFTVWDTGIGISAGDLQRLFQPFMQVDSSLSRRYEGAGLGLALVRRLAELHGGTVEAESREGQGSRFTIVLPWDPAERPSAEIASGPAEVPYPGEGVGSEAQPGAASALVLLAEDNEVLIRTLGDTLRAKGFGVVVARDGAEALELARQRRPALVLMDIQMPVMDGLEAIRQLRADPTLCRTPVIALTALTMPGDQERCLAAGANDYVSKPVHWPQLLQKMHDLLKT